MPKMSDKELQADAIKRIHAAFKKAANFYQQGFRFPSSIKFNLKGNTAGYARYSANNIRLHMQFMRDNGEKYLARTPAHEAAHLITFQRYGRVKHHGKEWKSVMRAIGQDPSRTHSYNTDNIGNKVKYSCRCGETMLGRTRHNRVASGVQTYSCRICKQTLVCSE